MTTDDEQYARHLRERYSAPPITVDPEVIVRRGRRRRRVRGAAGAALVVVVVAVGLLLGGVPRPFAPGPAAGPPPEPADARAALVISPATAHAGDVVAVTILNRGHSDLVGGVGVGVQRWNGRAWKAAGSAGLCFGDTWDTCASRVDPNNGNPAVPAVGISAPAGGSSTRLGLSTAGLTSGWYRLSMAVSDVSGTGAPTVSAAGQFEVVAPPVPSASPASSAAATPSTAPPEPLVTPPDAGSVIVGAVFGRSGQAVVTKDGAMLLTTDAGRRWSVLTVPGTPITGHWLDVHGATIAAARLDAGGDLTYERSGDGGETWSAQRLPLTMSDGGQVDVELSADGSTVAVAAQLPHSSGIAGTGALFVGPVGQDLVGRPAPTAGTAAWVGTHLVLVSDVVSARLFVSDDLGATWTQSTVEGVTAPLDQPVPDGAPSIGLPVNAGPGRSVLPVTVFGGGTQSIDLLATTDGHTFTSLARIPTRGTLGQGVTARGTSAGPDAALVVDPSSATLIAVIGTDVATITPDGLPGPIDSLTFFDATHGLASVTVTACPTGKASCAETTSLYASSDGGRTWVAARPAVG